MPAPDELHEDDSCSIDVSEQNNVGNTTVGIRSIDTAAVSVGGTAVKTIAEGSSGVGEPRNHQLSANSVQDSMASSVKKRKKSKAEAPVVGNSIVGTASNASDQDIGKCRLPEIPKLYL
jgi:hypothetical protein